MWTLYTNWKSLSRGMHTLAMGVVQNTHDRHKRKVYKGKEGIHRVKVIKRYKPISAKRIPESTTTVHAERFEVATIGCRPSSFGYLVDVQA